MTTLDDTTCHMCMVCALVYDPAAGMPDHGIGPGTPWSQVPANWRCPECGVGKEDFEPVDF